MTFFRLISQICVSFICTTSLFAGQPLTVTTDLIVHDQSYADRHTTDLILRHELGEEHRLQIAGKGHVVATATSEHGFAVLGGYEGTLVTDRRSKPSQRGDLFLILLDTRGKVRLIQTFGGPEHDLAHGLQADPEGWLLRLIAAGPIPEPTELLLDPWGRLLESEGTAEIERHEPVVDDTDEDETEDPEG